MQINKQIVEAFFVIQNCSYNIQINMKACKIHFVFAINSLIPTKIIANKFHYKKENLYLAICK